MCRGIVDEVTPYYVHLHGRKALCHEGHKMFSHRFVIEENPGAGTSFQGRNFWTNSLKGTPDAWSDLA